ncbi:hypothetical protein BANT10_03484 [Brevibacterium antiquum]|uniref:Uncharacterized protein n=3 Tax=Brevibacterium TaxID=1696 RepID=A0A2H1KTY3_BREAU|nr:hypothetical protein BANT10_03484 [Brevibacterium antiquum]SMY03210.1 hypothetical protein BAUR920_03616 [Brevibacterium aurantiacum]SMY05164.1 hypothetical protein BAURA86_03973 [Brevibacterium aurantiacum]SMY05415.1 hypothetical protein BANT918_03422 [Brevibacterium antiquum CNRZ 918]
MVRVRRQKTLWLIDLFDTSCISKRLGAHKAYIAAFHALAAAMTLSLAECSFGGDNHTHDVSLVHRAIDVAQKSAAATRSSGVVESATFSIRACTSTSVWRTS